MRWTDVDGFVVVSDQVVEFFGVVANQFPCFYLQAGAREQEVAADEHAAHVVGRRAGIDGHVAAHAMSHCRLEPAYCALSRNT